MGWLHLNVLIYSCKIQIIHDTFEIFKRSYENSSNNMTNKCINYLCYLVYCFLVYFLNFDYYLYFWDNKIISYITLRRTFASLIDLYLTDTQNFKETNESSTSIIELICFSQTSTNFSYSIWILFHNKTHCYIIFVKFLTKIYLNHLFYNFFLLTNFAQRYVLMWCFYIFIFIINEILRFLISIFFLIENVEELRKKTNFYAKD